MYRHTFCPLPRAPGGGAKKCVIAHPIHVSNLHIKFGWILSIGLGGDNVSIGHTDGGDYNIMVCKSVGKLKGMEFRAPCKHAFCPYTHP